MDGWMEFFLRRNGRDERFAYSRRTEWTGCMNGELRYHYEHGTIGVFLFILAGDSSASGAEQDMHWNAGSNEREEGRHDWLEIAQSIAQTRLRIKRN